jgi:biopolymer transport protein ExbD
MRRLTRPRKKKADFGAAALAPMVDMLTILLVFLLKSWSTDPPVRPDDKTFALPSSTSERPVHQALELDVTEEAIYLAGIRAAGSRFYIEQDETLIREIYEPLQMSAGLPMQVRMDEDAPYELLRKVLFTAQQAGVQDVTVVAASRSSL